MATDYERRAISVDDYYRMGDAEIFTPDERVESLDGELIAVPPLPPAYASVVDVLAELLIRRFARRAIVRVRQPISLPPLSEPEPDLSLVTHDPRALSKGASRSGRHASRHPIVRSRRSLFRMTRSP